MKKRIIKWIALCMSAVFLLAAAAAPVFAATLKEEEKEALLESTKQFVEQFMLLDDADLATIAESDEGFSGIAAAAVLDTREDIGAFQAVTGGTISQDGSNVLILVDVDCEKYDAQIEITYNADEYAPKNFVINPDFPLSVNIANAGRNTIIGLVVVFIVLAFLSFVISLFKHIGGSRKTKKKTQETDEPDGMPDDEDAVKQAPAAAAAASAVPATSGNDEIIAVIAAAIAAAEAESGSDSAGYVVRSIRKIGSSKRWKRA